MASWAVRRKGRGARRAGRQAARSDVTGYLGRAGLAARGVLYAIIGWIAVQVAFGSSGQQADRTGALHLIGRSPAGEVALWLLVAGFAGMVAWRLSEALFGAAGEDGQKATTRLASAGRAVIYAVIAWGVLIYALGVGSPQPSDQQSVDLTATVMRHPGGRVAVILAGLVLVGCGVAFAYAAVRKRFLRRLRLGDMGTRTRQVVERLGQVGGIARGAVFATAGAFLVVAAVEAQPQRAKGIDSALRALAATPLGPWLLLAVAIGLIIFGAYSCCEARWRKV
ncbi:MAG TPA: DUF1206 domain-containing protein [Trebonia sp.]|jgi:hypothetical protein|nr:DUF1206 domain-containing protein [Trebonia sp.]